VNDQQLFVLLPNLGVLFAVPRRHEALFQKMRRFAFVFCARARALKLNYLGTIVVVESIAALPLNSSSLLIKLVWFML